MKIVTIKTTQKDEIVDITNRVEEIIADSKVDSGLCVVFVAHTTACITTADLDPGTDLDFLDALRNLLPKNLRYRHPHDPAHAPDHILASIIGPSVAIPFKNEALQLGQWQRVILVELDGPRERTVVISMSEEA